MEDKILLIEDDALMESPVVGLRTEGFEITRTDDLAKSYLSIMESPPNTILTEYQLRDGTAIDLDRKSVV